MEKKNNLKGLYTYPSVRELIQPKKEYGKTTDNLTAAFVMWLLATNDERDEVFGIIDRAKRLQDNQNMIDRIRKLATQQGAAPTLLTETDLETIDDEALKHLGGSKSSERKKRRSQG